MNATKTIKNTLRRMLPEGIVRPIQQYRTTRHFRTFADNTNTTFGLIGVLVGPGETVIDIGANIGYYTACLSSIVGETGTVVSIEPVRRTFLFLEYFRKKTGRNSIVPLNVAVSDNNGTVRMEVPLRPDGERDYFRAHLIHTGGPSNNGEFDVPCSTLDAITEPLEGGGITFVKIDVEGHELAVLRGGKATIARHRPALMVEVWNDPTVPLSLAGPIFSFLRQFGYNVYVLRRGILTVGAWNRDTANYFFLQPHHVRRLGASGFFPVMESTQTAH